MIHVQEEIDYISCQKKYRIPKCQLSHLLQIRRILLRKRLVLLDVDRYLPSVHQEYVAGNRSQQQEYQPGPEHVRHLRIIRHYIQPHHRDYPRIKYRSHYGKSHHDSLHPLCKTLLCHSILLLMGSDPIKFL